MPLELHSIYTVDKVLTALDVHSEDKLVSFREGVKYIDTHQRSNKNRVLLFVREHKHDVNEALLR